MGVGLSRSVLSIRKHLADLHVCIAYTHTRVGAGAQFPSPLLMIDLFQRFSGKTKMTSGMGGQCQQPVFPRWVKAVEQGVQGSRVLDG